MSKVCINTPLPIGVTVTDNNTDQLVSVSGEHEFIKPGPGDIRGPCPGLNAASNHGYLVSLALRDWRRCIGLRYY